MKLVCVSDSHNQHKKLAARHRSFRVQTLDEVEAKAMEIAWEGLAGRKRPDVQLCFSWEKEIRGRTHVEVSP